jgi:hypothetical protein
MPESTSDASILIAISHQAQNRARLGDRFTILCDCTVMIVFAGYFIEANLNHIIEVMGKEKEVLEFWGHKEGRSLVFKTNWLGFIIRLQPTKRYC